MKKSNNFFRVTLITFSCLVSIIVTAQQGRQVELLNENWEFRKDGAAEKWEAVNLPHTWNIDDVMDDEPGYYRGKGLYRKIIFISHNKAKEKLFLAFEGANQVSEIFINGKKAGRHTGGYSAFNVPISAYIIPGARNEILVEVDNSHNANIPPLSADFTFYGGIYRDVFLISVNPVHFSMSGPGGGSVFINTEVNAREAIIKIKTSVNNESGKAKEVDISTRIIDRNGKTVSRHAIKRNLRAGNTTIVFPNAKIATPQLWSPGSPYLYQSITEIHDAVTKKLLDRRTEPLGFRFFHFDAEKGFFLNGKPIKLVGASRHQDFKDLGNAVPDSLAVADMVLLKEMGANFLRVAHYPQDPSILRACDSLGILASVEIPIVNEITESDEFYRNCLQMQEEMIAQHYNHPSVIMWCYMNEVLLRQPYNNDKEKLKTYYVSVSRLAKSLDSLTKSLDPYRPTMIAHHGDLNRYQQAGLIEIPDVVGWNLYSGWYGPNLADFPSFLDTFHARYPKLPFVVSEYGADADPRVRSVEPVRFDKSIEYTTLLHQYYYKEMMKRPFVAGAMIWNLADFNSETRTESMPHINNKGLLTFDRKAKDPYYFYKAVLSDKPFIKILGEENIVSVLKKDQAMVKRTIQVAANCQVVELQSSGQNKFQKEVVNGIAEFEITLQKGDNLLVAQGVYNNIRVSDSAKIHSVFIDENSMPDSVNILLGANRSFTDNAGNTWIPSRESIDNTWGHVGGKAFHITKNNRLPYGTDKNIRKTDDDPVYQTQQVGIVQYRVNVPKGEYEIILHFAELLGGKVDELPYNLNDAERIEPTGRRIFNIYINDKLWLQNFNIFSEFGNATAAQKRIVVPVIDTDGIVIRFEAIEGDPVLNAIQVIKRNLNVQVNETH